MTTTWEESKIANLLNSAFATNAPRRRSSDPSQPTANIDILITFDKQGVSSHPNHISLYHGARAFVTGLVAGKEGVVSPVDVYCLTSVNILRKYGSIGDIFTTLVSWWMSGSGASSSSGSAGSKAGSGGVKTANGGTGATGGVGQGEEEEDHPAALLFLNQLTGENALGTAWTAMTDAHRSQMVWFRYFWIGFSRYMVINDLRLENIATEGR
jgi:N-acetylglucosaminylphosphatidylinositol deacetylase